MNCSDCTPGNWLPGSPKGTEEDGAYLAKGPNQEDTNEKAVFLLTDIFGLISNPKIIADSLAELTGFDVWVPDLFNGMYPTKSAIEVLGTHPTSFVQDTRRLHLMLWIVSPPVARVTMLGSGRVSSSTGPF